MTLYHYTPPETYLFSYGRQRMDVDRKLGGEDLGEEERETIIGIYDLRKRRVFFNKKEEC